MSSHHIFQMKIAFVVVGIAVIANKAAVAVVVVVAITAAAVAAVVVTSYRNFLSGFLPVLSSRSCKMR